MSFGALPDRMIGYATYELAELLARLTTAQREAVDRIVEHVYIRNLPWALLFRDQPAIPISREYPLGRPAIPKMVSETNYYRRGKVDPQTGKITKAGWGHDSDFQAALKEAVKLALQAKERERLEWLTRAKKRAEQNADLAVEQWIDVMEHSKVDFARVEAASKLLELAYRGTGDQSAGTAAEADWWAAADGGAGE